MVPFSLGPLRPNDSRVCHPSVSSRLWVLYLYLVVIFPLGTLVKLVPEIYQLLPIVGRIPIMLAVASIADVFIAVALAIFSVYCGVAIKNIRSNAVRLTKAFLLIALAWSLVSVFFLVMYFSDAPYEMRRPIEQVVTNLAIPWVIFLLALYGYMITSRRVRDTFGSN